LKSYNEEDQTEDDTKQIKYTYIKKKYYNQNEKEYKLIFK